MKATPLQSFMMEIMYNHIHCKEEELLRWQQSLPSTESLPCLIVVDNAKSHSQTLPQVATRTQLHHTDSTTYSVDDATTASRQQQKQLLHDHHTIQQTSITSTTSSSNQQDRHHVQLDLPSTGSKVMPAKIDSGASPTSTVPSAPAITAAIFLQSTGSPTLSRRICTSLENPANCGLPPTHKKPLNLESSLHWHRKHFSAAGRAPRNRDHDSGRRHTEAKIQTSAEMEGIVGIALDLCSGDTM